MVAATHRNLEQLGTQRQFRDEYRLFSASFLQLVEEECFRDGGRTRARTWDPLIKSQLLYQLSYAPVAGRRAI